ATSVGDTSLQYVSIRPDGRINLLIWSDLTDKGGNSSEGDLFGSSAEGYFSSADGRRVDWKWESPKLHFPKIVMRRPPIEPTVSAVFSISDSLGQRSDRGGFHFPGIGGARL